jgi:hypothetical protein
MKLFDILTEDTGEEAKKRGLHHIGWGRYADKSGNVVAKSVDGKLVNIPKGEKDPVVDQPSGDIDDLPDKDRPDAWKGWKPRSSAEQDDLQAYSKLSRVTSPMMGSGMELRFRNLPPGEVTIDDKSNNPYVARNPDGKLASFSNSEIAAAFSQGNKLKGYDFDKDYDGSMERLKKELKPIMDKLEKAGKKNKFKSLVRDLFLAFIKGSIHGLSKSSGTKSGSGFGGGGGFSGGGGGASF